MPKRTNLPESASVATPLEGNRLHAPSAERNAAAIADVLRRHAPATGRALELASGTGQHAVSFAAALPGLMWQPTEIDAGRRASIDSWVTLVDLPNLASAIHLDATAPGWAARQDRQDLIVLVNLLHLISNAEARIVISETARALAPGGRFVLYGPFLRSGRTTSEGDRLFNASLQAKDPEIGYKNDLDVIRLVQAAGLAHIDTVEMPANNLIIVAKLPA